MKPVVNLPALRPVERLPALRPVRRERPAPTRAVSLRAAALRPSGFQLAPETQGAARAYADARDLFAARAPRLNLVV